MSIVAGAANGQIIEHSFYFESSSTTGGSAPGPQSLWNRDGTVGFTFGASVMTFTGSMSYTGTTSGATMTWTKASDALVFAGVAGVRGAVVKTNGATAITTTRAITRADSGGIFTVAQSSAYTITAATPLGANETYTFQCVSPGAFDVSIVATGCTFEGFIQIDGATIAATGSTLKFASGAASLGDTIVLTSTSATKFNVKAFGIAAGGITIT